MIIRKNKFKTPLKIIKLINNAKIVHHAVIKNVCNTLLEDNYYEENNFSYQIIKKGKNEQKSHEIKRFNKIDNETILE